MAQYYAQPRQTSRLFLATDQQVIGTENSIYVFPNPSSAPPSPSLSSEFSAPTDITFSGVSASRSRANSSLGNQSWSRGRDSEIARSPLVGRTTSESDAVDDPEVEVWDWSADTDSAVDEGGLEEAVERVSRWELVSHRHRGGVITSPPSSLGRSRYQRVELSAETEISGRTHHRPRTRSLGGLIANPHPRIHIPLLSFIASFLSVDDTTLHLLTHSMSHSALFPGHAIDPDPTLVDEDPPHGVAKLLSSSEEERSLKEGLSVACDPSIVASSPFLLSGVRLRGLWSIVSGVWAGGGNAWKEVWG